MALRVTSKSVDDGVVTLDVLYKLALLPAERASEAIGIKGSTFKKRLRSVGVLRWPHRRLKGVVDSYAYVAQVLASTLKSFDLSLKNLEVDMAVEELKRDLKDLEEYAYSLERSFLHTGQVETVVPTQAIVKLQSKVYKHRSWISTYTKRVVRGCRKC